MLISRGIKKKKNWQLYSFEQCHCPSLVLMLGGSSSLSIPARVPRSEHPSIHPGQVAGSLLTFQVIFPFYPKKNKPNKHYFFFFTGSKQKHGFIFVLLFFSHKIGYKRVEPGTSFSYLDSAHLDFTWARAKLKDKQKKNKIEFKLIISHVELSQLELALIFNLI